MKIFKHKTDLNKALKEKKDINFVPTMGAFHKGHLSLIKQAKKKKGKLIVSIFVNPKQFNSRKDFLKYPRTYSKDLRILKKMKVDYVFMPNVNEIYKFKPLNKIFLHSFSKKLCGKFRPGHFRGVINVVNRLIEIINPKYIFMGEKDFQQLILIKMHIMKRNLSCKIIPCKTIRNKFGVAFSSRNMLLKKKDLLLASKIINFLKLKKIEIRKKKIKFNSRELINSVKKIGIRKVDYIEIINLKSLKKPKKYYQPFNMFISYYINKIRLIDNF